MWTSLLEYIVIPIVILSTILFINRGQEHRIGISIVGAIITILTLVLFFTLLRFTHIPSGFLIVIAIVFWLTLTVIKNVLINGQAIR